MVQINTFNLTCGPNLLVSGYMVYYSLTYHEHIRFSVDERDQTLFALGGLRRIDGYWFYCP